MDKLTDMRAVLTNVVVVAATASAVFASDRLGLKDYSVAIAGAVMLTTWAVAKLIGSGLFEPGVFRSKASFVALLAAERSGSNGLGLGLVGSGKDVAQHSLDEWMLQRDLDQSWNDATRLGGMSVSDDYGLGHSHE